MVSFFFFFFFFFPLFVDGMLVGIHTGVLQAKGKACRGCGGEKADVVTYIYVLPIVPLMLLLYI